VTAHGVRDASFSASPVAEAPLDQRFAKLPELLRVLTRPGSTSKDVRRFKESLVTVDGSLFRGALLFLSRNRMSFMLVDETPRGSGLSKAWTRWPLRRLFSPRRACIITNPADNTRALAVPFATGEEWYVVLAVLGSQEFSAAQRAFLGAFEAFVAGSEEPGAPHGPPARDAFDRGDSDTAPLFVSFGVPNSSLELVRPIVDIRAWQLRVALTFGHLMHDVEQGDVDVVLLGTAALPDPLPMLRSLRHASGASNVPIVYFAGEESTGEIAALSDGCIGPEASSEELFQTLKRMVRLVSIRRREAFQQTAALYARRFARSLDCGELVQEIATATAGIGADWCAAAIIDRAGSLHKAEFPRSQDPVMQQLPSTFLSGDRFVQFEIDEAFFTEILEDDASRERIRALRPRSAVCVPITDEGRVSGGLFALSRSQPLTEAESQAMETVAALASESLSNLERRLARARMRSNEEWVSWQSVSLGGIRLSAYRGMASPARSIVEVVDAAYAIAVFADADEQSASFQIAKSFALGVTALLERFVDPPEALRSVACGIAGTVGSLLAAVIDSSGAMAYLCKGCPAPLQIPLIGPAPLLRTKRENTCAGAAIRAGSVTLLYGTDLAHRCESAQLVKAMQGRLGAGRGNPADAILKLSGEAEALCFVAITR
jgi:GAF domain-containing protein